MAVWSVVQQDPVPPSARRVGLPRRFTVHGGRHETARIPGPPSTLECSSQVFVPPVFRRAGSRQPFAGGWTLFAELPVEQHLLLAARQLRQVGHRHWAAAGFNASQEGILPVCLDNAFRRVPAGRYWPRNAPALPCDERPARHRKRLGTPPHSAVVRPSAGEDRDTGRLAFRSSGLPQKF